MGRGLAAHASQESGGKGSGRVKTFKTTRDWVSWFARMGKIWDGSGEEFGLPIGSTKGMGRV